LVIRHLKRWVKAAKRIEGISLDYEVAARQARVHSDRGSSSHAVDHP
jgi:hypothetical protein